MTCRTIAFNDGVFSMTKKRYVQLSLEYLINGTLNAVKLTLSM